jgi:hypothetical protein
VGKNASLGSNDNLHLFYHNQFFQQSLGLRDTEDVLEMLLHLKVEKFSANQAYVEDEKTLNKMNKYEDLAMILKKKLFQIHEQGPTLSTSHQLNFANFDSRT